MSLMHYKHSLNINFTSLFPCQTQTNKNQNQKLGIKMYHQTQKGSDNETLQPVHEMLSPSQPVTCGAEAKRKAQASVATGDGSTSLKGCVVKRSAQINRSWSYRSRLWPGKWTLYWKYSHRPSGKGILPSLSFTGAGGICNVIECQPSPFTVGRGRCRQPGQPWGPELGPGRTSGTSLIDEQYRVN